MKERITFLLQIILIFCVQILSSYAQSKEIKVFDVLAKNIEIDTAHLDEVVIKNSSDDKIHISLSDENTYPLYINVDSEKWVTKVTFEELAKELEAKVFRKYITKRINRASVVIKIPINKEITLLGTNVDIISESYKGNLNIFIDKGYINLYSVYKNANINLFQGNVYLKTLTNNINVVSNKGKIKVNGEIKNSPYQKELIESEKKVTINSIQANVFINK